MPSWVQAGPLTPEYFMYKNEIKSTHSKTSEDYTFLDPGALDETLTPVFKEIDYIQYGVIQIRTNPHICAVRCKY